MGPISLGERQSVVWKQHVAESLRDSACCILRIGEAELRGAELRLASAGAASLSLFDPAYFLFGGRGEPDFLFLLLSHPERKTTN
ncbi:hypothetical protein FF011L_51740 [Roseimaritima multifibrata]|uniref:Uncharacterized protein n=1 Tax=Roseimaritima multifibrata TaxID=1930274 RepID=A0A517MNB0_9BACT|nr:hypothetical protein FF011L_51740 [Roseimaritima multifibrata]